MKDAKGCCFVSLCGYRHSSDYAALIDLLARHGQSFAYRVIDDRVDCCGFDAVGLWHWWCRSLHEVYGPGADLGFAIRHTADFLLIQSLCLAGPDISCACRRVLVAVLPKGTVAEMK